MYKTVAGIRSDIENPGYKKMVIAPQPGGNFTQASAKFESLYGQVQSGWKIESGKFILDVTVPPNTTAIVILPSSANAKITESGKDTDQLTYLKKRPENSKNKVFEVGSGKYHFEYTLTK
ncbi:alpha-L-rhamnosidase C-terminal domain-containing protein [Pedobacter chinensis]|uniref:alpha-L-rhamnosidase C-terminal domain-containing protein n=1 Tax=Pedobacter chinensis TaxID=2282421 RepID=UPI0021D03DE4|nr:alpha-L-rhamnosidase C-terminal domain-containing protein [Pedobacter chinensis]